MSGARSGGRARLGFQRRHPVEQVDDEAEGCVVDGQAGPQPLDPGEREDLGGGEPQVAVRGTLRFEQAEGDQPPDVIRMRARGPGEGVHVQEEDGGPSADQRIPDRGGHRRLLGSKPDTAASCSKRRRSSSVNRSGTITFATA